MQERRKAPPPPGPADLPDRPLPLSLYLRPALLPHRCRQGGGIVQYSQFGLDNVSLLVQDEGYTVKYSPSPIFDSISGVES